MATVDHGLMFRWFSTETRSFIIFFSTLQVPFNVHSRSLVQESSPVPSDLLSTMQSGSNLLHFGPWLHFGSVGYTMTSVNTIGQKMEDTFFVSKIIRPTKVRQLDLMESPTTHFPKQPPNLTPKTWDTEKQKMKKYNECWFQYGTAQCTKNIDYTACRYACMTV